MRQSWVRGLTAVGLFLAAILVWNGLVGLLVLTKAPLRVSPLGATYVPGSTSLNGREGFSRIVFDRLGFNNDERTDPVDVLVLGDSHTEALQVPREANFVSVTERLLRESGSAVRLYNAGIAARSLADYWALGKAYREEFHPRLTVIQLSRADLAGDSIDVRRPNHLRWTDRWELVTGTESEASAAVRLLAAVPLASLLGGQLREGAFDDAWGTRAPFGWQPGPKAPRVPRAEPDLGGLAEAEIGGLRDTFGPGLMLLYLRYTPSLGEHDIFRTQLDADDAAWEALRSAAFRQGVTLVDTGPAFNALLNDHQQFPRGFGNTEPDAGHLNAAGHRAVATALAAALRERR